MYSIIANLGSGKGAGKKCLDVVEKVFQEKNIEHKTFCTSERGSGKVIAERLCRDGTSTIIAIGGDGTFHEVLNGMDFSKARLALVPAGRGNDYAASAGISFNPKEAIQSVIRGAVEDRDYIQLSPNSPNEKIGKRCLNVCGTGLDVEVLKLTEQKQGTYIASLAKLLLNYKPYTVQVEADGFTKEYKCIMAAFCNGSQFGGGIKICPPAKNADGKMDLMIVKQPKVPTIAVMPAFVAGRHIGRNWVEHVVCERAKIIALDANSIEIDGEIYGENILDAQIVKGGFKTFAIS